MKLKFRLSILVIAVMIVVVAGISILLLSRASSIALKLNHSVIEYLSGEQAEYWSEQVNKSYVKLETLAEIMADYQDIDAGERRKIFDTLMGGTITSNPDMVNLYTVWKPNAIDGMDAQMIGRTGSTATGQYAIAFTREHGAVETRVTTDVDNAMAFFNGPNSRITRVEDPFSRIIMGKAVNMLRVMVPVIDSKTNQVVGGVGELLNTDTIQPKLAETVKNYEEITYMAIYHDSGFIIANTFPDRIGKNLLETETFLGDYIEDASRAV
ncbi:MAG: hypothetical protein FWC03_12780, partial [Treponema sp.]|nr:hypothetical protein [Treponema sp.]